MKRKIAFLLMMLLFVVSCGKHITQRETEKALEAMKSGNIQKYAELLDGSQANIDFKSEPYKSMLDGYKKIEYKVHGTKVTGDKAVVNLDIKAPDLTDQIPEFFQGAMVLGQSLQGKSEAEAQKISDEYIKKFFQEKLNSKDLKFAEKNINLEFKKEGNKWILDPQSKENLEYVNITSFGFLYGMQNLSQ